MTLPYRGTKGDLLEPVAPTPGQYVWTDGTIRDAISDPANIISGPHPELIHSFQIASMNYKLSAVNGTDKSVASSDSRLTDARTPTAHTHVLADITNAGTAAGHAATDFDVAGAAASAQAASQPLDADLTAIAALSTTSFGRGGLTQADAASFRTYIGAGTSSFDGAFSSLSGKPTTLSGYGITDAQPLDSDLTSIAALTTTSFGRGALTQADAAAFRTYIGAGSSSFDGAYSSLSGIPSTFAPSAHHASHQNGGSDEIATATAGANAIPKAGSGGTLAIGWLPTGSTSSTVCVGNDARLSDSRQCNNNFDSAATSRTNLGLGTLATQSGTFSGTSSGTNTGDQTITLTSDVTGSGTGSFAVTIANGAVTFAKQANMNTGKLIGRSTAGSGSPEELTPSTGLSLSGGNLTVSYGSTGTTACVGNDSRLSDSRPPTAHHTSHETGGSDAIAALAGSVITTGTVSAARLPTLDAITAPSGDVSLNTHKLTNVVDPTAAQDAATKNYVDVAVAAIAEHQEVKCATTVALSELSYTNNGGVGDLLTIVTGVLLIDGQTLSVNDRVLIKNQANAAHNGIYKVQTVGLIGVSPVFIRATDFDQEADGIAGGIVFVSSGTVNDDTRWECSVSGVITWGTTNLNWSQYTGGVYTADETTLHLAGTTFSVLSTWAGQTAITTVGTITTGTWTATPIAAAYIGAHASTHKSAGSDSIKLDEFAAPTDITTLNTSTSAHGLSPKLSGNVSDVLQGDGNYTARAPAYVIDAYEIPEPRVVEIGVDSWLEIDESDGSRADICYTIRQTPASNQCLAETSSLYVLDYYDITEPYTLEIPATALIEIAETSGVQDFDIS